LDPVLPLLPPVPIPIGYAAAPTGICFPTLTEEPKFQEYAWGIEVGVVVEVSIEETNPPAPPPPPVDLLDPGAEPPPPPPPTPRYSIH
jgi:hypothetical protein